MYFEKMCFEICAKKRQRSGFSIKHKKSKNITIAIHDSDRDPQRTDPRSTIAKSRFTPPIGFNPRSNPTVKDWLGKHPISTAGGLECMEERVRERLKECARHINENYDLESVCRGWPDTMRKLRDTEGDRLNK